MSSSEVGHEAGWRGQLCWDSPVSHRRDWLDPCGSHRVLMPELLPTGQVLARCSQGNLAFWGLSQGSRCPQLPISVEIRCLDPGHGPVACSIGGYQGPRASWSIIFQPSQMVHGQALLTLPVCRGVGCLHALLPHLVLAPPVSWWGGCMAQPSSAPAGSVCHSRAGEVG